MTSKQVKLGGSGDFQDIGTVGQNISQLAGNMQSVNQILDVGLRNTRNYSSGFVRVSDLVDLGFCTLNGNVLTAASLGGTGGTITVNSHIGINTLAFSGATVTVSGTTATITITGGGGSLSVTDGTTTVASVTSLRFTSGATVTSGGAGIADVAVASGGTTSNVTPDTHSSGVPAFLANDEFEGASLDTTGTRFAGAIAWTWSNQLTSTITLSAGNAQMNVPVDGTLHYIYQPTPTAPWKYRAKIALNGSSQSQYSASGLIVLNNATGNSTVFGPVLNGSYTRGVLRYVAGGFTTNLYFANDGTLYGSQLGWTYYEIENDGTNLHYRISPTGADNSFFEVASEAISVNIVTPNEIGIVFILVSPATMGSTLGIDWFRRTL